MYIYLLIYFLYASTRFRVMASSDGTLRSHSDTPQLVGLLRTGDRPEAETSTWQHTTLPRDKQPRSGGFRIHNPSKRAAANPRLRPPGHWDRLHNYT